MPAPQIKMKKHEEKGHKAMMEKVTFIAVDFPVPPAPADSFPTIIVTDVHSSATQYLIKVMWLN